MTNGRNFSLCQQFITPPILVRSTVFQELRKEHLIHKFIFITFPLKKTPTSPLNVAGRFPSSHFVSDKNGMSCIYCEEFLLNQTLLDLLHITPIN